MNIEIYDVTEKLWPWVTFPTQTNPPSNFHTVFILNIFGSTLNLSQMRSLAYPKQKITQGYNLPSFGINSRNVVIASF